MNQLNKLTAMHIAMMGIVQSELILKESNLSEGLERNDDVQHTSDQLLGRILIIKITFENVIDQLSNEDLDGIKKSLGFFKKNREKLKFNIQNDKIDKVLLEPLNEYIQLLNNMITVLDAALDKNDVSYKK